MRMVIFWLVAAGIFLLFEVTTTALVSVWFAVGTLTATAAAVFGAALWLQVLLFILVSAACFILLYPRVRHLVEKNRQPTNADKVIGQVCFVVQRVDNLAGTGTVSVDGKIWTARTADGEVAEAQSLVKIERIEGVKLIVSPVKQTINV